MCAENKDSNKIEKFPPNYFQEKVPQKPPIRLLETVPADEKPTGNFYDDMEIFFKQLSRSFEGRYELWENTFVSAMNMLREIREKNEQNTEIAIKALRELEKKILKGFDQFKLKRDEIERYTGFEIRKISQDFNKTLILLKMQIKEYVLEKEVKELHAIYF